MTYDTRKSTEPEDVGPHKALPPCELSYAGHIYDSPRFPSGDCVVCGALCTEGCRHPLATGDETEG